MVNKDNYNKLIEELIGPEYTSSTPQQRAVKILEYLPLSSTQRKLYISGANKMSDEEADEVVYSIMSALDGAPKTLEYIEKLIAKYENPNKK